MTGRKLPQVLLVFSLTLLVGVGLVSFGKRLGEEASLEAQQRMAVVWPSLFALTVEDRVVVLKAAFQCRVHRMPVGATAADVAKCLRSGAREYDDKSEGREAPISEKLEVLLADTRRVK